MKPFKITAKKQAEIETERADVSLNQEPWFQKLMAIASLTPKDFKPIFGKQSFVKLDGANRRLYCWAFEHMGEMYFFFTGSERGTTLELTSFSYGDSEQEKRANLHKFVNSFCEKFKEHTTFQEWLKVY